MEFGYREPVYTIGVVAKLLKVCPATLRIWEKKNLIKPTRLGKNRFYSKCDIDRLEYIKELIQKKRINIEGVKSILNTTHCWTIKNCKPKERNNCKVYQHHSRIKF
ncbi:MAG: MerR family transcriptional regulator [Candidatus Omnitrophica bacterium]|nr:MerR family transcriptional regulator [Candidatus Omnitrophota bacterium]MCM8832193.1 MerR family transcriptional regulator [Candidatus Omnitrophota bacterium]